LAPSNSNKRSLSLTQAFLLACLSVLFCWFYGLPALVAGYFALRFYWPLRKKTGSKKASNFKLTWGYRMAWAGFIMSALFFLYYLTAFISGAFIRW
jgi:hypothetical protein